MLILGSQHLPAALPFLLRVPRLACPAQSPPAQHSHPPQGLNEDGTAIEIAKGLVGQQQAREAAGIMVDLIKCKKMAGRGAGGTGPFGAQ